MKPVPPIPHRSKKIVAPDLKVGRGLKPRMARLDRHPASVAPDLKVGRGLKLAREDRDSLVLE